MTKIYALLDEDSLVRYVGKTSSPLAVRLTGHLHETRCGLRTRKCEWIRSMLAVGSVPKILLICYAKGNGNEEEKDWIAHLRESGAEMTNISDGGDGRVHSAETRQRISLALRGRKVSEEAKRKMLARVCSEENRRRTSLKLMGHKVSEESRNKIRNALSGRPLSEETKQKMRLAHLGKKRSEETKQKIRLAHIGMRASEETKKKMSLMRRGKKRVIVSEQKVA